jgi:CHAT domain-containing protein/Tfp pilus assembly protein PilF
MADDDIEFNRSFNRIYLALPTLVLLVSVLCVPACFTQLVSVGNSVPGARLGVVVEAVIPDSAGQDAGLLPGDVILSWSREKDEGRIESPFDWDNFLIEQAPRGSTTLRGLRKENTETWTFSNRLPGVAVRPALRGELRPVLQECRELEGAGKFSEAGEKWRALLGELGPSDPPWLAPWLQFQLALALESNRKFSAADGTFQLAIGQLRSSSPRAVAQVLRMWGNRTWRDEGNLAHAEERYRLSLADARNLVSPSLIEARALMELAIVLGLRGDWSGDEEYALRALTIYKKLAPDSTDAAASLYSMGWLALHRNATESAEAHYQQALAIWRRLSPGQLPEASTLTGLGAIARSRGNSDLAEKDFQQALAIRLKLAPQSADTASLFVELGLLRIHDAPCKGAEYFQQAVAIDEKVAPNSVALAWAKQDLGLTKWGCGDFDSAENQLKDALTIMQRIDSPNLNLADSEINLAQVLIARGHLAQAEAYLRDALKVSRKLAPEGGDTALILKKLGDIALGRGDLDRAEEYDRQGLTMYQKLAPASLAVASSLSSLGRVEKGRNNLAKAEEYYGQALAIQTASAPSDYDAADSLSNLGDIAEDRGDLARAKRYYGEALAVYQKLAPASINMASSLASLAGIAEASGDLNGALEYRTQALAIEHRLAPGSLGEAKILHDLGCALKKKGSFDAATEHFARAVDALESQTERLGGTQEVRSNFRATFNPYYWDLENVLVKQKRVSEAYQVSERSRAQSLLQMLAERDLLFASDVPADLQLSKRHNASEYDRTQAQLSHLSSLTDKEKIDPLLTQMRSLSAEREQITEKIKKTSPRFASLQYPTPMDLAKTRDALDSGTVLLSYSVGEDHTILFVVLPNGQEPGLSVFALTIKEKLLRKQIESLRSLIQQKHGAKDSDFAALSRELYALLLKPAEAIIRESERLLVVADGPLQVLPFSALMRQSDQYVAEWKPVHTVVSATVYAELKKTRRAAKGERPIELAAFGDPVYPTAGKESAERIANPDLVFAEERGFSLARLPFSRQEVEDIGGFFAGHSQTYLGAEATEEHAKAVGKDIRYIHFATHGLLDERFPLNSALVLTIPTKVAEGQDNGLLQAWEIFEQMRLDADLVTLSACNTGMGQELSGEGLIGLTRAFQYAGARSILASLWSVNDLWTMELMKDFYGRLKAGSSKDVALQSAQADLIHSRTASSPYYWAAFSLIGDWQ